MSAAGGIGQNAAPNAGQPQSGTVTAPNAAEPQGGPVAAANAAEPQSGPVAAANDNSADPPSPAQAIAALTAAITVSADTPGVADAVASPGKRTAADGRQTENSGTGGSGTAAAPTTPIVLPPAAAIAAPVFASSSPPPNAATAGMAIGESIHSRTNATRTGSQQPQGSEPAPPAGQQQAASNGGDVTADAATSQSPSPAAAAPATTATPLPSTASAQQADNAASPQASSAAVATADTLTRPGAAVAGADGSASSNAQTAINAVQSATANLPTFGIAAPGQTVANASTVAGTAAVPISGLPIAIAARSQAGVNQFDIRLDPPELGRIDVRLGIDANGQVTSHVTVDRPETLALLQSQQPQLERALEQAGLKTADNGLQFSLRDQSFAGGNSGSGGDTTPNPAQQLVIPDADLASVDATQIYSRWNLGGGIDITV